MEKIEYSYKQVRHILGEQNMYLEVLYRYKERTRHYNVRKMDTDEIVMKGVTLNYLRYRLTAQGYAADYDPRLPKRSKK